MPMIEARDLYRRIRSEYGDTGRVWIFAVMKSMDLFWSEAVVWVAERVL